MNFKMIEALLLSVNGFTGTISDRFIHLKDAANSTEIFHEELKKVGLPPEKIPEALDEALVSVESEYGLQGFINGFRMGAQLMLECIGPAPLDAWDPNQVGKPGSLK